MTKYLFRVLTYILFMTWFLGSVWLTGTGVWQASLCIRNCWEPYHHWVYWIMAVTGIISFCALIALKEQPGHHKNST